MKPISGFLPQRFWSRNAALSRGANRNGTARRVAGLFSPQSRELQIEVDVTLSPAVLKKLSHAGTVFPFEKAERELAIFSDIEVPSKQIERWTERIGNERVEAREAQVESWSGRPLPERRLSPVPSPQVAVISMDGGRFQMLCFFRAEIKITGTSLYGSSLFFISFSASFDEFEFFSCKSRVDMALSEGPQATDPCPLIPEKFVTAAEMRKLSRDIGHAVPGDAPVKQSTATDVEKAAVGAAGDVEKTSASDEQPSSAKPGKKRRRSVLRGNP